jgi:hypothetical protein
VRVETATDGDDWFARVTPLNEMVKTPALTIEGAVLWNRPGRPARRRTTGHRPTTSAR